MDRRKFIKTAGSGAALIMLSDWEYLFAKGASDTWVGKPWKGWTSGEFQVHFIYTGLSESMFMIFPDGTSMLLDCGEIDAINRSQNKGWIPIPVMPGSSRHAGEWIARYVLRVNPHGADVDYMMASHYHEDHFGCKTFADRIKEGTTDYPLSGFSLAAEYLNFAKGIDRAWPEMVDPLPTGGCSDFVKQFYDYQIANRGMKAERFRLGASDQVVMVKNPKKFPSFKVRNIAANGRIALPDGTIKDLYAERIAKNKPARLNENGMSLGMMFTYGPFSFYTGGDFSDQWRLEDGSIYWTEDDLAQAVSHADVSKLNHHGCVNSMPRKLVEALSSRVWISCVWDQPHTAPPTIETLSDKTLYPGDRVICPACFTTERRLNDVGKPGFENICKSSFDCGHIVLNVEKGGKDYSISYLKADDESMEVRSVMRFASGRGQ